MTLVDHFGSVQLAIQAAVKQAFKTPEVIRLFAKKEPSALRQRLNMIERERSLKKLKEDMFIEQAVEILTALKKLGDELSDKELQFLQRHSSESLKQFLAVDGKVGDAVLDTASSNITAARSAK
eukprot:TRINITY_DN2690_c0_g1::TRINITY_DN2690_c0_g1_i1::g.26025::m.26025 TRINITY_DN2690_c0_g1::TRINITY_DN2690_c0_g1_i1::g.26025  ORF type:complete len:124 (+),score=39.13,sp/Q6DHH7/LZIC_DANRE/51.69/1e-31,ICAT/PF06384.6/3.8e-17,Syntaxin-18_N/PF10496.4/0.11,CemA/PF03040.9/0.092,DUF3944/PF13099.1/0.25 TRINITY_DN2690_c0_g1_i1:239-610(+)